MAIPAELAYFFRQPILRDAAYQLQMPSDRARLHRLALEILETMFDGPPPEPELDQWGNMRCEPHPSDHVAADLANHIQGIRTWEQTDDSDFLRQESLYLRRAAEHAESQYHTAEAVRLWRRLAAISEGVTPSAAAESLRRAGAVFSYAGYTRDATSLFKDAQVMANLAGDRRTEGLARENLASTLWMSGRMNEAEEAYEQALALHREVANRRSEGMANGNLANLYRETGRVKDAEEMFARALEIHREVDDRRSEGIALGNLANLYLETGRAEEAEQAHKQALAVHIEVGNRRFEGIATGNLAVLYEETERLDEAERTYEQALTINREVGSRDSEGIAMGNLANVYRTTGRTDLAEQSYEHALAIHREVSDRRFEGVVLGNLAGLYQETGREVESDVMFGTALHIHREIRNRLFEGVHSCDHALCLLALNRKDAREVWRKGEAILAQMGDTAEVLRQKKAMREACAKASVPPFDE